MKLHSVEKSIIKSIRTGKNVRVSDNLSVSNELREVNNVLQGDIISPLHLNLRRVEGFSKPQQKYKNVCLCGLLGNCLNTKSRFVILSTT
jgi:hypothetical protein